MKVEDIKRENFINLYNEKGEKHGLWEQYHSNSQLHFKGDYVDGKEHGLWEAYYYNGQLQYKGNYVAGKQHGYWEYYWDNGQLGFKGEWVNGKLHGYWESYYVNGKLKRKGYYDMGKRVDYNPDEPKIIELTLTDIAVKFNIPVEQLRIKK